MADSTDQITVPVSRERLHRWADQARQVYADWDREWTTINESIEDRGLAVLCQPTPLAIEHRRLDAYLPRYTKNGLCWLSMAMVVAGP